MGSTLILWPGHPAWPPLLNEIHDPPRRLEVRGDPTPLAGPCLAIVGTRRATPRGLAVAHGLAACASRCGWTVVSGLALGIDAAAHAGALEAGGRTIAVLATGIDRTYPRRHENLRRRLEVSGCSLTEAAPGTPPLRHLFPRRNRLVAGLSRGVIVVEAPLRSGAMITARLALDANREVMAVPGPVDQEVSRGCHRLLRDGAALVESWADVARTLSCPGEGNPGTGPVIPSEGAARWIFDRLDLDGVLRDRLRGRWDGTEDMWQQGLLALETAGLIRRLPGGRLARSIWTG